MTEPPPFSPLEWALFCSEKGFSLVPIAKAKKSCDIPWSIPEQAGEKGMDRDLIMEWKPRVVHEGTDESPMLQGKPQALQKKYCIYSNGRKPPHHSEELK